jgi:hypothetical protein
MSEQNLRVVVERLSHLFGPDFEIQASWDREATLTYSITAWKDGRRADWIMVPEDFLLSDLQIEERFIKPVKGVWKVEPGLNQG